MLREEKVEQIREIETIYRNYKSVIVTHYHGLTVSDITSLRAGLRENKARLKVVKNTLALIAARNAGYENTETLFKGPVAICYSEDPVSSSKLVVNFSEKKNALKVVGGIFDDKVCGKDTVFAMSKLPGLNEIRANIAALLNAPAAKIVGVTKAPAEQLARVLYMYSQK